MNQYLISKREEFVKVSDFFKKEIVNLRTGRANPGILDGIQVEAYGTYSPLNGVASINVPDGHCITVAPWDRGVVKDVEKAIVAADLGVGVVNEGHQIRLTIPKMTEENRKELVKKLNEKQEAARISIRKVREEIKNAIDKAEKDKGISEDEKFLYLKELDEEVEKQNGQIKDTRDKKEADIMTI